MLIDHERALGFVRKTPQPSLNSLELDRYYDHVFYPALSPSDGQFENLAAALGRLSAPRIEALLGRIPAPWQAEPDLTQVRDYLSWVVENRLQVCELIRERLS